MSFSITQTSKSLKKACEIGKDVGICLGGLYFGYRLINLVFKSSTEEKIGQLAKLHNNRRRIIISSPQAQAAELALSQNVSHSLYELNEQVQEQAMHILESALGQDLQGFKKLSPLVILLRQVFNKKLELPNYPICAPIQSVMNQFMQFARMKLEQNLDTSALSDKEKKLIRLEVINFYHNVLSRVACLASFEVNKLIRLFFMNPAILINSFAKNFLLTMRSYQESLSEVQRYPAHKRKEALIKSLEKNPLYHRYMPILRCIDLFPNQSNHFIKGFLHNILRQVKMLFPEFSKGHIMPFFFQFFPELEKLLPEEQMQDPVKTIEEAIDTLIEDVVVGPLVINGLKSIIQEVTSYLGDKDQYPEILSHLLVFKLLEDFLRTIVKINIDGTVPPDRLGDIDFHQILKLGMSYWKQIKTNTSYWKKVPHIVFQPLMTLLPYAGYCNLSKIARLVLFANRYGFNPSAQIARSIISHIPGTSQVNYYFELVAKITQQVKEFGGMANEPMDVVEKKVFNEILIESLDGEVLKFLLSQDSKRQASLPERPASVEEVVDEEEQEFFDCLPEEELPDS